MPVLPCPHAADYRRSREGPRRDMSIKRLKAASAIEPPAIGTAETTLSHVLARRLADSADKAWVVGEEGAYTYRDIDRLANRLANGLARLGLKRGETVLLMLNNS